MATTSTPKLENFLGGEAMGTPHYECSVTETMPLSLDSVFYSQSSRRDPNNQAYQNHVQPLALNNNISKSFKPNTYHITLP